MQSPSVSSTTSQTPQAAQAPAAEPQRASSPTPASARTVIQLDHVSFSYGHDAGRAVEDVSLSIEPGEFVGLIGPSGAGKSTLAAIMSGAIPHHYTGQLYGATLVEGQDTCDVTLTDISRIVGSVLQDIDAQMVASVVEDELLFGLENFGVPHRHIEKFITAALDAVGIADLRDREIATLSGGQKQKVAIAAILALAPRVLVLDEPTAALDPVSSEMVFDVLRSLNRDEGITVVVIEQKVALLSQYCDRILVMNEGRLELQGTPAEVFAHSADLRRIGVDSPRTARISNSLAAADLVPAGCPCLTVDEAYDLIAGALGARGSAAAAASPADSASAGEKGGSYGAHPDPKSPAPSGAQPAVAFEHVGFAYPAGGAAVTDLNLAVYPGEVFALIGQNGAGKTTATKLLNGLLRPTEGRVTVAGHDTRNTPVSVIARYAATLFQNPDRQLCKNTVLDEVAFGLELQGVDAVAARERARAVIRRFGLPEEASPFSLSRGQRQMVALASVVVLEPQVIVLDEPTSGLDYRECMTVMQTVADMARAGSAVVMVCHDMEVVSDFADRAAVMAEGRIVGMGPLAEVFRNEAVMAQAYVAPPQVTALSERLARGVSPAFAGIGEVAELVDAVRRLAAERGAGADVSGGAKTAFASELLAQTGVSSAQPVAGAADAAPAHIAPSAHKEERHA